MDITLELTKEEHAVLLKVLREKLKYHIAYGETCPQYANLEERDLIAGLLTRWGFAREG